MLCALAVCSMGGFTHMDMGLCRLMLKNETAKCAIAIAELTKSIKIEWKCKLWYRGYHTLFELRWCRSVLAAAATTGMAVLDIAFPTSISFQFAIYCSRFVSLSVLYIVAHSAAHDLADNFSFLSLSSDWPLLLFFMLCLAILCVRFTSPFNTPSSFRSTTMRIKCRDTRWRGGGGGVAVDDEQNPKQTFEVNYAQ